jgi:biotin synthase
LTIKEGKVFRKEIDTLLRLPLEELMIQANRVRNELLGTRLELCSIINAKSGLCSQDCKFCAQAARHKTGIDTYALKSEKEIVEAARNAKKIGAERFGIVTSGERVSKRELAVIAGAVREISENIGIKACASLGAIGKQDLLLLKKAGLSRYHHNIETSPRYFDKIVSRHSFEDRLKTIRAAKKAGLEVCSGGIIGMGENQEDRIQMALILREMNVDSVPINILIPVKGTALEKQNRISRPEVVKAIALFRIILKDKTIRLAAGRESVFGDSQSQAFMAGANGMMIGGYLTVKGRPVEEDWKLIEEVKELWKK